MKERYRKNIRLAKKAYQRAMESNTARYLGFVVLFSARAEEIARQQRSEDPKWKDREDLASSFWLEAVTKLREIHE